ncbi:hypothetical protein ACIQGO_11135 [Streptomyces shenzhenensis]|uniref:hypothetical protein n=1 Tax=Streptomyces shenzhenensis TaxID=943815 RepID=UPI0038266D6D
MSLDLLRCPVGHTFDIARHGYVGLLTGTRATSGDDVAMVRARGRFLSTGAYAPIRTVGARLAAYVVLNVFAPRNPAEFHRVLRPTGRLIVIRPTGRHLAELRGRLPAMVTIDPAKEQRLPPPSSLGDHERAHAPADRRPVGTPGALPSPQRREAGRPFADLCRLIEGII